MAQRFTKSQIEAAHREGRQYWWEQRKKHKHDDTIAAVVLILLAFGMPLAIMTYQRVQANTTDQMRYNQIMEGSKDHAN